MNNQIKIGSIGIILLCSIAIFIYLIIKYNKQKKYKRGYQYIYNPKDITTQSEPPKTNNYNNIDECVDVCEDDPNCGGLTYNTKTNTCTIVSRGAMVEGQENHIAWKKDNFDKSLLMDTLISKNPSNNQSIPNKNIVKGLSSQFCMAFKMNIIDFYSATTIKSNNETNHKVWKHILHKGKMYNNKEIPHSDKWEDVISLDKGIYYQDIGFWLAPYTNNIRICFRIDQEKANMNESQDEKIINKIQYVDVLNVPINKFFFIAVNVNNNIVEVQLNNKINTITFLNGYVNISNEAIHIKYKPFFEGEIKNLHFIPEYAGFEQLTNIYNQD